MKTLSVGRSWAALLVVVLAPVGLESCGNDGKQDQPGQAFEPTAAPLGGYEVGCDKGKPDQSQQQVSFQQQRQSGQSCAPQFEFIESKVSDFVIELRCNQHQVLIKTKGKDPRQIIAPIAFDGSVKGQMVQQQQVSNDGRGNLSCWIEETILFDGSASCNEARPKLNLTTQVDFAPTDADRIPDVTSAIAPSDPFALPPVDALPPDFLTATPSPSPRATPISTPMPLPTATPAATPRFSPTPSSIPTPSATPSPSESLNVACDFSNPQTVNTAKVTLTIPRNAAARGCKAFGDRPLRVQEGTEVTWINGDEVAHTITADGFGFASGTLSPDEKFTTTLEEAGTYTYHSETEPKVKGEIIVVKKTPGPTPSPSASLSPRPSPSASPSRTPPPRPTPTGRPGGVTVIRQKLVCVVQNPCRVIGKTDFSCNPSQQNSP